MGDFRPSHMLERVWLHALDRDSTGCNLSRDAATCEWRERVARCRDLFIARTRARLEEVVLVCLWSLTGPL